MAIPSRSRCLPTLIGLASMLLVGQPAVAETASKRLAVLELKGANIQREALAAFEDAVRGGAVEGLSGREVDVITSENMLMLLREMGKTCAEGDCEVETARNIGADFVVSGSVARIDDAFVVTLKLHETKRGSLLATDQIEAKSQLEILRQLREHGRTLAADNIGPRPAPEEEPKIREKIALLQIQQKDQSRAQAVSEAVPSNVAPLAAPPKFSDSVSTTPPPPKRQAVKFSVLNEGDKLDLQIETPKGVAKCDKSISFTQPCELVDLPAGPARVVVSGSANFSKNVVLPVGSAFALVGKSGHGLGWASLFTGAAAIALWSLPLAGVVDMTKKPMSDGAMGVIFAASISTFFTLILGIVDLAEDHQVVEVK